MNRINRNQPYFNQPMNYNYTPNPNYNYSLQYQPNYNYNPYYQSYRMTDNPLVLKDHGPRPYVVDIEKASIQNNNYRTALWTGRHLQTTLMSINVGDDIGLEVHPNNDQFIRIEEGQGEVLMGNSENNLNFREQVSDGYAIFVPAGKWHNVVNTGDKPLKLYSIYAPVKHPFGTIEKTKQDAMAEKK